LRQWLAQTRGRDRDSSYPWRSGKGVALGYLKKTEDRYLNLELDHRAVQSRSSNPEIGRRKNLARALRRIYPKPTLLGTLLLPVAEKGMAMTPARYYLRPSLGERLFNRLFGAALTVGVELVHNYLLEVAGRTSGRLYTTPVNLLQVDGRRYLVAPRGETNWVRNVRAAGRIRLRKGRFRLELDAREITADRRAPLLKAYLDRFAPAVQRYFPVVNGAPASAFEEIAARYPVFELTATGKAPPASLARPSSGHEIT